MRRLSASSMEEFHWKKKIFIPEVVILVQGVAELSKSNFRLANFRLNLAEDGSLAVDMKASRKEVFHFFIISSRKNYVYKRSS